jgi:hypothetical protein
MELPTIWQDWVIAVGQLILFVALLPSIFSDDKPNNWSSLISALVIALFGFTFWTLGLLWSAFASVLASLAWFILFFQKQK